MTQKTRRPHRAPVLGPLILPPDVDVMPVDRLPGPVREQIGHQPGDHAVTRQRSRTTSTIVDASSAALLERFREPTTIVDAVISFCADEGLDPRTALDDAFPVLAGFIDAGLLVAAGSPPAASIGDGVHEAGDRIDGYTVAETAHVIIDTEVHRARAADGTAVALKIARDGGDRGLRARLTREAEVLESLGGRVSPRLIGRGEFDGRPYIAMSWCAGAGLDVAAAQSHRLPGADRNVAVLELAERLLESYAALHAQGILHGDVHPRNVLASAEEQVTVIDFGLAGPPGTPRRGGVDLFQEPEMAEARLAGRPAPPLTAVGEQYGLGALVYLLLTGAHTHAFSLEEEQMLRQLRDLPPLPFSEHGVDLPEVEVTVGRALAKRPGDRYASVADFLAAFRAAAAHDRALAKAARPASRPASLPASRPASGPARHDGERLLESVLRRLSVPGELFGGGLRPPTASVMNGGSGFAYALLRVAGVREDERLLALADLWSTKALHSIDTHDAFWNEELEIVPENFGDNSFYHHTAGVHAVQALIARTRGDEWTQRVSVDSFSAAVERPCEHVDTAFGRAGLLLGCASLLETLPPGGKSPGLRAAGDGLSTALWAELRSQPAFAHHTAGTRPLGAAHGWAGYLYAMLRWSEATGTDPVPGLDERLDQLAGLAVDRGRGLLWPFNVGGGAPDPLLGSSWCNGAAGHVFLWTLAHTRTGDEDYARLARRAAWSAYEGYAAAPGDLCCGLAGRAYALLCHYRHTGEKAWLARARHLADGAAVQVSRESLRPDSLYKGQIGVALLVAELRYPEHARMPLYEGAG